GEVSFVLVCVQTPSTTDGDLDGRLVERAFAMIRERSRAPRPIVVNKSTVPVGTGDRAESFLGARGMRVVSNPEFFVEGRAMRDFFHPDRMVFGSTDRATARAVRKLYARIRAPVVYTDFAT